ncbi:hypothetical protein PXJ14_RS27875, partial [Escherichia coli]
MTDNVIVGHAGCGVNALSGLQILKHSISCNALCRPDKRSASGNYTFVTITSVRALIYLADNLAIRRD